MTGEFIDQSQFQKVHRVGGQLIGIAGDAANEKGFLEWMRGGVKPKIGKSDFEALVLKPSGALFYYTQNMDPVRAGKPNSIGSGATAAMGAMLAGSDPAKAVRIAKKLDGNTGGKVWSFRLKP